MVGGRIERLGPWDLREETADTEVGSNMGITDQMLHEGISWPEIGQLHRQP